MKIIIAYVSAGTGHRRAAEAVYNYFKENCPGIDLKIIDALDKTNFIFRNLYSRGYLFLVNHALWLWHFVFWFTSIKALSPLHDISISILNRLNAKVFFRFLIKENPDFIVSTHFFPSEAAAALKKNKKINSKLITVITDFGVHPLWVLDGTDMYIVASAFTKEKLIAKGVSQDAIKDLGIPIDLKFSRQYDKNILCRKLGIEPDKFTVLISTGSSGIGEVEEIVESLYRQVQVLVVCAHNKILYAKLTKKNYAGVKAFGFIENMQELMAVSDMIITKPGGLTISESLAMGLLPVFITAIPGQETENARILAENSIGINIKDTSLIKDIVLGFKEHPDKLKDIKERINKLKKPLAVKDLRDVIC